MKSKTWSGPEAACTPTFLIVDDHLLYRKGIRAALELEFPGATVIEADDGEKALVLAAKHSELTLCTVDIGLPKLGGAALVARLTEACPALPVVINSGSEDLEEIANAIDAGGMGFVHKSSTLDSFLTAINAAMAGNIVLPAELSFKMRQLKMQRSKAASQVSKRQIDVLALCAEGLTNREISQRLNVSEATVKAHLATAMEALDKGDRTSCVVEAIRRKWINPL